MNKTEKDLEKQADLEAKRQIRKQQVLNTLRDDPNNLVAIKAMVKISRQEGNTREEQRYLYRILEIEPDKPKIVVQLIRLAKNNNDIEEIRRLRRRLKTMQPSKAGEIKAAISISSGYKDVVSCKILYKQLEDFMKRNYKMSWQEESKTIQTTQARALEKEMLERTNGEKTENPIRQARRIIYESKDISRDAETIKRLLERARPN